MENKAVNTIMRTNRTSRFLIKYRTSMHTVGSSEDMAVLKTPAVRLNFSSWFPPATPNSMFIAGLV
jgi:hypothetical protein